MWSWLLYVFAQVIGYRFLEDMGPPPQLPERSQREKLESRAIRDKSVASLAAAGVFLGFSIAVIAAVLASNEYRRAFAEAWYKGWNVQISSIATVLLLGLVARQERILSRGGDKRRRYVGLGVLFVISVLLFGFPFISFQPLWLLPFFSKDVVRNALPLAGCWLLCFSIFFQAFAVEFYDSAAGWRGGDEKKGAGFRFHLASLASNCFLLGIWFAILGTCLLAGLIGVRVGSGMALLALVILVSMTEFERALWPKDEPGTCEAAHQPNGNGLDRASTLLLICLMFGLGKKK